MKELLKIIDKIIHPNRKKQEEMMKRINELKELSVIASEHGINAIYRSLNREMNELFMQYMVFAFLDGVIFLIPHFFMIWMLSLKFSIITLPFNMPGGLGNQIGIVAWYPLCAISYYVIRWRMRKKRLAVAILTN